MEANELRIGNLVYNELIPQLFYYVKEIKEYVIKGTDDKNEIMTAKFIHFLLEDIKSIPLTKEWLLKFGFKESEDYNGSWLSPTDDYGSQKRILSAVNKEMFLWQYSDYNNVKIKYVHQLQNLYFALTQKELKIK